MSPGQIALFIIVSVLVIIGAYYSTYFLATRTNKRSYGKTRAIRLRDRFAVSKDKSICLFEVKDKIYLVALTGSGATLLDTFYLEEFDESDFSEQEIRRPISPSMVYEPQGFIEKGIFKGFNAIKNSIKQSSQKGSALSGDNKRAEKNRPAEESAERQQAQETAKRKSAEETARRKLAEDLVKRQLVEEMAKRQSENSKQQISEDKPSLKFAQEEDDLDLVYRKLQSRRAGTQKDDEMAKRQFSDEMAKRQPNRGEP